MRLSFPTHLPINQRLEELKELISHNQIVVVAGETGSGKTTQIPKMCLSLGLHEKGIIAHTQPRRIAARSVAERIAFELQTPLGNEVGYQVRFTDVSSKKTKLKLMTDGVLLQELQHDRQLKKYSVVIIDEAHERSLNIDFLLGLLKPLCESRPNLKVIITSATIDLQKFANHFGANGKPAPIIEVSGRTYPVDVIYDAAESAQQDLSKHIVSNIKHIIDSEARGELNANGDILVFCAGEREIREAQIAIQDAKLSVDVMPLYARLGFAQQNRVFAPSKNRKIVLATNVAETSLTVPGIGYVIDPGVARISRYSFRSKIQRLPIEKISQASANQRKGRCGRVANGVCIRLYEQDDFEQRDEFTQAEILRSNLAAVILKMLRLGIKDVYNFAFLDTPDKRFLNDGFKLLQELKAVNKNKEITPLGRQMSDLSVDPKYARILIAANQVGCLRDAIVLVSALSIQDLRERPADQKNAADQMHSYLAHPNSDFMSTLQLWQALDDAKSQLSNTKFKVFCHARHWSIARYFEWRELIGQVIRQVKSLKWSVDSWEALPLPYQSSSPPHMDDLAQKKKNPNFSIGFNERYIKLHQAMLSGLVSNIVKKTVEGDYQGARANKLSVFPASSLAKTKPDWLLSAELIETSRLYAHHNAQVKPEWIIASAPHLCKYQYSSPHYHVRSGSIKANRKTTVFGLIVREKEKVNYAPINASESRQVFIQSALVDGAYRPRAGRAEFVTHNQALVRDIEKLETKTRRRNLLVNDRFIYDFFEQRIPNNVYSRQSLEKWLANENQDTLKLDRSELLQSGIDDTQVAQFPDQLKVQGKILKLSYRFTPGEDGDGVTLDLPITLLNHFPQSRADWLVPGLLHEKCVALLKTLAKPIRRQFAPAGDAVSCVIDKLNDQNRPLVQALAEALFSEHGVKIQASDFAPEKLDSYYHLNYRLIDVDGSLVEEARELNQLKARYAQAVKQSIKSKDAPQRENFEKSNMQDWECDPIPKTFSYKHAGMTVTAFPALNIGKSGVDLCLFETLSKASYAHHNGVIALALKRLENTQAYKYLSKTLLAKSQKKKTALAHLAIKLERFTPDEKERRHWIYELLRVSLCDCCFAQGVEEIRDKESFDRALHSAKGNWVERALEWEAVWFKALEQQHLLLNQCNTSQARNLNEDTVIESIKAQLYRLFKSNRLRQLSLSQAKQYSRYLKACQVRLDNVSLMPDLEKRQAEFDLLYERLNNQSPLNPQDGYYATSAYPSLLEYEFLLEEWRVSLFAQQLKTRLPVSAKRLDKFLQKSKLAEL